MMTIKGMLLALTGGLTRAAENKARTVLKGITLYLSDGTGKVKDGEIGTSSHLSIKIALPKSYLFQFLPSFKETNLYQLAVDVTKSTTKRTLERILSAGAGEPVHLTDAVRYRRDGSFKLLGLKLGGEMVAKSVKNGRFEIKLVNLSASTKSLLVRGMIEDVRASRNRDRWIPKLGKAFPVYTGWQTSREYPGVLNSIFSKSGDMFAEIVRGMLGDLSDQEINVLRIRAGKDGWSEMMETETRNILIIPEELLKEGKLMSADGYICMNDTSLIPKGGHSLVRGTVSVNGRLGIVKARILHSSDQYSAFGGASIPDSWNGVKVDGISSSANIKWLKGLDFSNGPILATTMLGLSKEEMHDQKDAYRVNLVHLLLGRWTGMTRKSIMSILKREAFGKTLSMNDLRGRMDRILDRGMSSDEEEFMVDSYLSRYVLGFLKWADPKVSSALNKLAKGFMSGNLRESLYTAVIYQRWYKGVDGKIHHLKPSEFAATREVRDAIQSGWAEYCRTTGFWSDALTLTRHPVTGPASYLSMKMAKVDLAGVTGMMVVCSPEAAIGHQGDCDDHLHIACGHESLTTVENMPITVEKEPVMATGDLNDLSAIWQGATSQNSTGILVAAYYKTVATVYDNCPDQLPAVLIALSDLAQSIQDSVQGIKKFVDLTVGVNEVYDFCDSVLSKLGLKYADSPTSEVVSGQILNWKEDSKERFASAVSEVFGTELKIDQIFREFSHPHIEAEHARIVSKPADDSDRIMLREIWIAAHQSHHMHLAVVDYLLEKIVGTSRAALVEHPEIAESLDAGKVRRAVVLYGVYVHGLFIKNEMAHVRGMNGMACLLAERLLSLPTNTDKPSIE